MKINAISLLGALIEHGSEPVLIESIEDAETWAKTINEGSIMEITEPEELSEVAPRLNLTTDKLRRAFSFVSGSAGSFALSSGWDYM